MDVFLSQKAYFWVRTSLGEFFFIMALDVINEGGTPYMGISPGRARASFIRLHCCMGRVSLKKSVFSCEGK